MTISGTTTAPDPPGLWRQRPFMLLWGGQAVSEVGSNVSALVLPLLAVAVLHATTFEVAALNALGTVPFLLLSLPAGVVADRVRKRRLMLWCDLGRLALTASLPLAALTAHITLGQLYAVAAGVGILTVFFEVAYQSCLPALVPPGQLVDANGKFGVTESLAQFAGPPLGGVLTGAFGAARATAADAASYAVSAASLLLMRLPEPRPERAADRPGFRAAMAEGLAFLARHAILRKVVACTTTANFFGGGAGAIGIVFLVRVVGASPTVTGLVLGLSACGGTAGGLLAAPLARRVGSARIIWAAVLVPAPLTLLRPLAFHGPGVLLYAAGSAVFSFSGVVYNTAQVSYRQTVCPPALLGRLNASVRWFAYGALPLGALAAGGLANAFGVRAALWICVGGCVPAGLWVLASPLRGMRDVPTAAAPAAPAAVAG